MNITHREYQIVTADNITTNSRLAKRILQVVPGLQDEAKCAKSSKGIGCIFVPYINICCKVNCSIKERNGTRVRYISQKK